MFLNSGGVCIQLECSMGGDMATLYVLWVPCSVTQSPLILKNLFPCVMKSAAHFQVAFGFFTKGMAGAQLLIWKLVFFSCV